MPEGFATAVKNAAKTVKERHCDEAGEQRQDTEATGTSASALSTTDSLRQKAAKSAAGLAKVEKESKRLQIQESVLQGRNDAKDIALAYAVGNLDESIHAMSEVTLQLQAGKAKIHSATNEELIVYVEAGIDENDVEESMGNLLSYSGQNGGSMPSLNLLEGVF